MEQDMMTRLATGVFLRSVITILGWPPSATLQRYMCRNDLPWGDIITAGDNTQSYLVSPLGDLHNLINVRIPPEIKPRKYQLSINFNLQGIWGRIIFLEQCVLSTRCGCVMAVIGITRTLAVLQIFCPWLWNYCIFQVPGTKIKYFDKWSL